jgi:hypothetical protein
VTHSASLGDDALSQAQIDGADVSHSVARGWEVDQVRLRHVSLAAIKLEAPRFTDVVFDTCDLAGAIWTEASLIRVAFVDCRLSGFALNRSTIVDLAMRGCRGECPSVFESEGRRWLAEESQLLEMDCRGLRLADGRFDRCQLAGSQWGHAKLERVSFVRSDLRDVGGRRPRAGDHRHRIAPVGSGRPRPPHRCRGGRRLGCTS